MLLFVCFNRHYLICSAGNHLVQQGRAHFRLMPPTNCGYASLSHVSLPRRFLSNVFCGDKHPDTGVFMRNDFAHNCVPHGENRHTFFLEKNGRHGDFSSKDHLVSMLAFPFFGCLSCVRLFQARISFLFLFFSSINSMISPAHAISNPVSGICHAHKNNQTTHIRY